MRVAPSGQQMLARFFCTLLGATLLFGCSSNAHTPSGIGGAAGQGGDSGVSGEAGSSGDASASVEAGSGGAAGEAGRLDAMGGEAGDADGGDGGAGGDGIPEVDESELPAPVSDVGFIELEPRTYSDSLASLTNVTSTRTRLFYRFVPADADAKSKPVFVIFNGGPGFSSMLLMTFGTGPLTLDGDAPNEPPKPNPHSLTTLGSLLYIDSRHAGFSYGVADDASDVDERRRAFLPASFNPEVDAADFVRVLLRVLEKQPALRNNPVVLLGESYGATRANLMLDLLLHSSDSPYRDPDLMQEISAHFQHVFAGIPTRRFGSQLFAKQFGWQVLIQPLVAGSTQQLKISEMRAEIEGRMAASLGVSLETLRASSCPDVRNRSQSWCDAIDPAIGAALLEPSQFMTWMGRAPETVLGLAAAQRGQAFRFAEPPATANAEPAPWLARVGALTAWDTYFSIYTGERVPDGFSRVFNTAIYTYAFARSTRDANTLITNAAFDATLPGETLVPALRAVIAQNPGFAMGLSQVDYVGAEPEQPSERIRFVFGAQDDEPARERIIYFPRYSASGHMVTMTEPAKFSADVRDFLDATGAFKAE